MVHELQSLRKIKGLASVNELAKGNYQHLPMQVGIINSITSDCGEYRLFRYPSVRGCMKLYTQQEKGQFVFVECSQNSIDLLGKGEYENNFDLWADQQCWVLCEVCE